MSQGPQCVCVCVCVCVRACVCVCVCCGDGAAVSAWKRLCHQQSSASCDVYSRNRKLSSLSPVSFRMKSERPAHKAEVRSKSAAQCARGSYALVPVLMLTCPYSPTQVAPKSKMHPNFCQNETPPPPNFGAQFWDNTGRLTTSYHSTLFAPKLSTKSQGASYLWV